jgi:hypothetical protein
LRATIIQQIAEQTKQLLGSVNSKFVDKGELCVERYVRYLNDNFAVNSDIKDICISILNSFGFDIKLYCTVLGKCKSRNGSAHEIYYDALSDESIDTYCSNNSEKEELKQIIKLLMK